MEKEKSLQHVQVPNGMISDNLEPIDLLVYASIKRFDNPQTKCFPSLNKIRELTGLAVNSIRKSIDKLKESKYITTKKEGRNVYYYFNPYKNFEVFSYDFLDKKDLTASEKAYILVTQQHMYKKDKTYTGVLSYSERELAELNNMSKTMVHNCNESLKNKGYLRIANKFDIEAKEGDKVFDLAKFGQSVVFAIMNHEERISEQEERQLRLEKQIEELQKKLDMLTGALTI
jgi:DNA-binding transcriptional regulator YhcF (GntR family)